MKDNHNSIPAVAHELAAVIGRLVGDNCDADERDNAIEAVTETMALAARNQRRASVKVKRRREVSPRRSAYLARYGEQGHNYTLRNL